MALGNRLLKGKVRALQKESSLLSAITVDRKSSNIKPLRVDRQRLLLRLHIRRFEEIRRPFAAQQAWLVTICTAPLPSPTSVPATSTASTSTAPPKDCSLSPAMPHQHPGLGPP